MTVYRICFLSDHEMSAADSVDGVIYDLIRGPNFSGIFGSVMAIMWDTSFGSIKRDIFNYTVVRENEFGSKDSSTGQFQVLIPA